MLHRPLLLAAALAAPLLPAQSTSAAAVTASGRDLGEGLRAMLAGRGAADASAPRTVMLLIDPGPALRDAGFVDELRRALERDGKRLGKTRVGVAGVGARGTVVLAPGTDTSAVVAAVRGLLAEPSNEIRNVYHDVRAAAAALANAPGRRELLLVALQNGDAEDDLEATARICEKYSVVFHCLASEAYLADSYWAARPYEAAPPKCTLTGGDAAFVDLPWGFLLQTSVANEIAPSAYAGYGFSRLAAATGGSVHLFAPRTQTRHQCAVYGGCLFCDDDHSPAGDTYWRARVMRLAPSAQPRREVFQEAAGDPAFRAMLSAWEKAFKLGLVRGSPSVKATGNSLQPQRSRVGKVPILFASASFKRQAAKAEKLAKDCDRILAALQKELASIPRTKGVPRYRALAELTAVMLQLTKVNLLTFAGFCEDVAPGLVAKRAPELAAPEVDPVDRTQRAVGIGYSNHCLCHGAARFAEVELPGGAPFRQELATLSTMAQTFEALYGHTPAAAALHRSGIAHFWLTYPGVVTKVPRKRPRSSDDNPVTERGRPPRAGGSSGGTAGPTTGK